MTTHIESVSLETPNSPRCAAPFLKWAGGKRWLLRDYAHLFPPEYDRYIEPFLGGGSIFFALAPELAILGDTNAQLIETYSQVRDNPVLISELLRHHHADHSKDYYYSERKRNHDDSAPHRAAKFIYLNRTCWNGLYRVNLKGEFNVPKGTKDSVLLDTDDFNSVSKLLANAQLCSQDFAKTLQNAGANDFVYIDPPYTVKHKYNSFVKYNEKIFTWDDQVRLRDNVVAAIGRGAKVAVSNADHYSIRELYNGIGTLTEIKRHSVIAADRKHRGEVDELLIRSWTA